MHVRVRCETSAVCILCMCCAMQCAFAWVLCCCCVCCVYESRVHARVRAWSSWVRMACASVGGCQMLLDGLFSFFLSFLWFSFLSLIFFYSFKLAWVAMPKFVGMYVRVVGECCAECCCSCAAVMLGVRVAWIVLCCCAKHHSVWFGCCLSSVACCLLLCRLSFVGLVEHERREIEWNE